MAAVRLLHLLRTLSQLAPSFSQTSSISNSRSITCEKLADLEHWLACSCPSQRPILLQSACLCILPGDHPCSMQCLMYTESRDEHTEANSDRKLG